MEEKKKIFRDAVHGYISISAPYVSKLIDSFEMQRLKDVAQTGIRPIYSGATHDRFSYSIGVYHIGTKIFTSFKNALQRECDEPNNPGISSEVMDRYEQLYYVACILHDIGHPAFSHTFEYLYNNKYINLEFNSSPTNFGEELKRIKGIVESELPMPEDALAKRLMKDLKAKSKIKAQPHEMMSAYQILNSNDIKNRICACLNKTENEVDFDFIARMIIGLRYATDTVTDAESKADLSIRNCIIGLLNGVIDADSIDYLNRNSQAAGYDTYHLDIERICNAFSVYYDEARQIFRPCFSKTTLSAPEGFVRICLKSLS